MNEYPTGWDKEAIEKRDIFKYYCPICLRYFNHILVSDCCNNYICRFCIGQQAKKAKLDDKYVIQCAHCSVDNFRLEDANETDNGLLKFYTDTPFKYLEKPESHITPGQFAEDCTPGQEEGNGLVGVVGEILDQMELRIKREEI